MRWSGPTRLIVYYGDYKCAQPMKYIADRPFADPEKAARKLLEIASTVQPIQDGRIHIEKINGPFLFTHGGSPAEYGAGLALAIAEGGL
jgi:hypothetical protein